MKKVKLFIILMTTFYMQGCSDENQAVAYFDQIYLPVQELLEIDEKFQENLSVYITTDEGDSLIIEEDLPNFENLNASLIILQLFIEEQLVNIDKHEVYKSEFHLKQASKLLFTSYANEIKNSYPKIIELLKKQEVQEAELNELNELLQQTQYHLDTVLDQFYVSAMDYADRYHIELEDEE